MKTGSAQRTPPRSSRGARWAIVLALAATPVLLQAQQTGSVVGVVTDGATGQPLSGAAISIGGTMLGALTDGRGRFIIRGVQSGPATVRAQRLGYHPEAKPIAVNASDSV
ncbi:MAG TPA: carboxypeptidase-like regulatory domain-containing protein, partial [Gemmatimonadaceae bacterium]